MFLGAVAAGIAMAISSSGPAYPTALDGRMAAGVALGFAGAAILGLPALGFTLLPALLWVTIVQWASHVQPPAVVDVATKSTPWPSVDWVSLSGSPEPRYTPLR
jgi:hypothetical protein